MSGMGPEVLPGSNQRPETVLIPSFYFVQERLYLRCQTCYSLFLVKTSILLYYKQADQQSLDFVQVKAHDIRAFEASKAFSSEVSVDQIMQACHWKAHTFTNFYLKYLTWSDNDNNMYQGPVVVAQQVLDPSPETSHPRKEKKGGTSATVKLSGVKGLGICLPPQDVWQGLLSFISVAVFNMFNILCVSPGEPIISLLVFILSLIAKIMRFSTQCLPSLVVKPLGLYIYLIK